MAQFEGGTPADVGWGTSQGIDDAHLMAQLSATQKQGEIALTQEKIKAAPYQLRQLANQTEGSDIKLAQERRVAAVLAQSAGMPVGEVGPDGTPTSMASPIYAMASRLMPADPEMAAKLMAQASQMSQHEQAAALQRQHIQDAKLKDEQSAVGSLASALDQVHTQEDWNNLKAFAMSRPEYAKVLQGMPGIMSAPYSPELVNFLQSQGMSYKDKLELARQTGMTNAQIKAQEALTRDRESAQRLSEARTREVEARERKIESAGGKEAPAAHARADVIKSADAMIGKDYPNMSKDDRTLMSRNVASQAAAIQRANKGISDDQALAQAYQAEINTGAAQRGSKEDGWKVLGIEVGGGKQKPDTYDRRGTPLQPLTLPAVNGKVDVSKLVEGKHYQVNGQIGRWNAAKKGFDVVGQ